MRGSVKAGLVGGLKSLTVAISCIFHAADFGSPKPIWVFEHVRRGLKLYSAGQRNRRRFVLEPRGKGITRRDHREEHWSPRTSAHAQAGYIVNEELLESDLDEGLPSPSSADADTTIAHAGTLPMIILGSDCYRIWQTSRMVPR
jgi:hypothetical protein